MNKKELADAFLLRADDIIDEIHCRTMGEDSIYPDASNTMIMKYFDIFADITRNLAEVGEIQRITAESTADVITMLKQGELTIRDAKDLMQLLSTQSDIEDMKKLLEKMEALGGD